MLSSSSTTSCPFPPLNFTAATPIQSTNLIVPINFDHQMMPLLPLSAATADTSGPFLMASCESLTGGEVPILSLPNPYFMSADNAAINTVVPFENRTQKNISHVAEKTSNASSDIHQAIKMRNVNAKKHRLRHHIFRGNPTKPHSSVEHRNARERNRVHTVNQAFNILRKMMPALAKNTKRVSKLKILRATIQYVRQLLAMLAADEKEEDTTMAAAIHWPLMMMNNVNG